MGSVRVLPSFRALLVASLVIASSGCGKLGNVVQLNFDNQETSLPSSPFLGLTVSSGTKTSGIYKLEAGIGEQVPGIAKTSGQYKLYGGIQGQAVSR